MDVDGPAPEVTQADSVHGQVGGAGAAPAPADGAAPGAAPPGPAGLSARQQSAANIMKMIVLGLRALGGTVPAPEAMSIVLDEVAAGDSSRLRATIARLAGPQEQGGDALGGFGGGEDLGHDGGGDQDYGDDPATASDDAKRAARDDRVRESAFHAEREHSTRGFASDLLAAGSRCDADGCMRRHVALCFECDPCGRLLCAEHDHESHALAGLAHARSTLLLLDVGARGVLHSLDPNQYVRATFEPATFSGCAASDIEHGVPVLLPAQPSTRCLKCRDVRCAPVPPKNLDEGRVRVFGLLTDYTAVMPTHVRCLGWRVLKDGTKVRCGETRPLCPSTPSVASPSPVHTVGATITPLTTEQLRTAVETSALSLFARLDAHTQKGISAGDFAKLLGREQRGDVDSIPLASLRPLLWRGRQFRAFHLPVLKGLEHQCLACGGNPRSLGSDCNQAMVRYRKEGPGSWAPEYAVPGGFWLSPRALGVLTRSMEGYMGGAAADKSCGSTTWTAAGERDAPRSITDKLAVQGATLAVCPHRGVYAGFAISTPEKQIYHLIMLLLAVKVGARFFAIDIACQFFRHLRARAANNPGFADPLVRSLSLAASAGNEIDVHATVRFELSNASAPTIIIRGASSSDGNEATGRGGDVSSLDGDEPTRDRGEAAVRRGEAVGRGGDASLLDGDAQMRDCDEAAGRGGDTSSLDGEAQMRDRDEAAGRRGDSGNERPAPVDPLKRLLALAAQARAAMGTSGAHVRPVSAGPAAPSSSSGSIAELLTSPIGTWEREIALLLPLAHAEGHQCRALFCGTAVDGAGWHAEVNEQVHAQAGPHARSGQGKNMGEGAHADFHHANLRLFNVNLAHSLPNALLDRLLARMAKLERESVELESLRASLGRGEATDAQLSVRAAARASRVLAESSASADGDAPHRRVAVAAAWLAALQGCVAAAVAARAQVPDVDPRDSRPKEDRERTAAELRLAAAIAASEDAAAALRRKRQSQQEKANDVRLPLVERVVAELEAELAAAPPMDAANVDRLICKELETLYVLSLRARTIRAKRERQHHEDLLRKALERDLAAVRTATEASLRLLHACMPKSPSPGVAAAASQLPTAEALMSGSAPFPTFPGGRVGAHVLELRPSDDDRLLDAYQNVRALRQEIAFCVDDVARARDNVVSALYALAARLADATAASPALASAAGNSGLFQVGPARASLPTLFALPPQAAQDKRIASGVAAAIFEGVCDFVWLFDQLDRLQQASSLLLPSLPAGAPVVTLAKAAGGLRTVARVEGKQLLTGSVSPAEWAASATGTAYVSEGRSEEEDDADEDEGDDARGLDQLAEAAAAAQDVDDVD